MSTSIWIAGLLVLGFLGGLALLLWGTRWGSTAAERARRMPGDDYLEGGPRTRAVMTRAISIEALPERVWPWISQLGRGAGWYSVDWLDNGRRVSAWHVVSWIPEPRLGDATAVGYLRHLDPGRSLVWWLNGGRFLGSSVRLVTSFEVLDEGKCTRLISRMSADTAGLGAHVALLAFFVIDSIMASRQLIGIRNRVEHVARNPGSSKTPENGDRDQYQLYEILYAGGERAGVAGRESGAKWRQAAIRDGVVHDAE